MKKITNYKLFEAFESEILGKTLRFVKPETRNKFLSNVTEICDTLDFPKSELSDDMFQYLPFKKALFLNSKPDDSPCDATSDIAFPDYSIEGEICNGGMIKRKWGRGTRVVSCPVCGGTGIKVSRGTKIKWLKFWFDKDGRFIRSTMTDGKIRNQSIKMPIISLQAISSSHMPEPNFSKRREDYDIYDSLSGWEAAKNLPMGTIVYIDLNGRYCVGMVWRSDNGMTYIIQDESSGSEDDNKDWKQFGRFSWVVNDVSCLMSRDFEVLVKKGESIQINKEQIKEPKKDVNPYTWNISYYTGGNRILPDSTNRMEELLKDAHFALIMDFDVFKQKDYKKVSLTKAERSESKTGTLKFKSDEQIRRENIQRYINQISDRISISGDFKELPKHIVRLFGLNNAGTYVLLAKSFSSFNNIISLLSVLFKAETDVEKEECIEGIKKILKLNSKLSMDYNDGITRGLQHAYGEFQKTEEDKAYIPILDAYYEINKEIVQLIRNSEIETIEDLDVLYAKLSSIRRMFKDNERYSDFRCLESFITYIDREDSFRNIKRYIPRDSIKSTVENMKRFAKMVSKL